MTTVKSRVVIPHGCRACTSGSWHASVLGMWLPLSPIASGGANNQ